MRGAGRLMSVIGWLLVAGAAALLLWLAFGNITPADGIPDQLTAWQQSTLAKALMTALALLLVIIDILALLSPVISGREEKNIQFPSALGEMTIEVSALEDCLKRTVLKDPAVGEAAVTIKVPERGRSDPIVCNLNLGVHEQSNVPGKADEITVGAKQHILDVLPLDSEPLMRQRVRILRPKKERMPKELEPAAEPDLEPVVETEPEPERDIPSLDGGLIYGSPASETSEVDGEPQGEETPPEEQKD